MDFLDDEATEDAWAVSSYLSDADCLLFTGPNPSGTWTMTRNCEPDHISQLIAASVSARGVLFANSQPSAPRLSFLFLLLVTLKSELNVIILPFCIVFK